MNLQPPQLKSQYEKEITEQELLKDYNSDNNFITFDELKESLLNQKLKDKSINMYINNIKKLQRLIILDDTLIIDENFYYKKFEYLNSYKKISEYTNNLSKTNTAELLVKSLTRCLDSCDIIRDNFKAIYHGLYIQLFLYYKNINSRK